jgi:hypothetical protein
MGVSNLSFCKDMGSTTLGIFALVAISTGITTNSWLGYELHRSGILEIASIPSGYNLNEKQQIQCRCINNCNPYIEKDSIRHFLGELEYPLYYLDFETFGTAIPLFDGTRPYQNIPFQFSLHVKETPDGQPKHYSCLAEGKADPRPGLIKTLSRSIGINGSVIAYNKSFEEGVLASLGDTFAEYKEWTEDIISRLIDLITPFKSFHYYHPNQKGSASLKSVLPALTGLGYEDMDIANGNNASLAYLTMTFGDTPAEEAVKIRQDLLEYCKLDTGGMVRIVKKLEELVN